jgi:hypothetical protein
VSFRLMQFPPQSSTRVIRLQAIREPWSAPVYTTESGFLRSWIKNEDGERERTNWGAIYGLALSLLVSVGFWTGVGVIVERVWK